MEDILLNLIKDKCVLILGFGMEGRSTYNIVKRLGTYTKLDIADINLPKDFSDSDVNIYSGEDHLDHIDEYDITFKSPGIVLPKSYKEYKCKITSQTEVFLQVFRKQVIGITGTKGKSTVSSLLYHVLSDNNVPCILAGNIGKPVFDIACDVKPDTIVVLELSSHQLEICNISPATAVFLNIFEDHLDHYGTFERYYRAKKNIYLHQKPDDVLYCGASVKPLDNESLSKTVIVNTNILPAGVDEAFKLIKLHGKHNLENAAFVYTVSKSYALTDNGFLNAIKSYTPLPHRLEYIGTGNGIDFYDDSISTTVESTINAVESIANASTLLLGGMDRGIDYTALVEYLSDSRLSNIICMYQSGKRIFEMFESKANVKPALIYCTGLIEAVKTAKAVTPTGTACLLSPASASYGDFKNFEERGRVYKSLIFDKNG